MIYDKMNSTGVIIGGGFGGQRHAAYDSLSPRALTYIDGDQPCVLEARLQELVSVACTVGSAECHCFLSSATN